MLGFMADNEKLPLFQCKYSLFLPLFQGKNRCFLPLFQVFQEKISPRREEPVR